MVQTLCFFVLLGLFVDQCEAQTTSPQKSLLPCHILRTKGITTSPTIFGSPTVCGTAKVIVISNPNSVPVCAVTSTYVDAVAACTGSGMRLCSAAELAADEVRDTGCNTAAGLTWAYTSASDCAVGAARAEGMTSLQQSAYPLRCVSQTRSLAVRCCADEYWCQNDECSTSLDSLNICQAKSAGTGYTCTCNSARWTVGPSQMSCVRRLCQPETCSSDVEPKNKCVEQSGNYTCQCTTGYTASADSKRCVVNVCRQDPCKQFLNSNNQCIPTSANQYQCWCAFPNFTISSDGSTCVPTAPAGCPQSDPCQSSVSIANKCVPLYQGSSYTCNCNRPAYTLVLTPQAVCVTTESVCDTLAQTRNPCGIASDLDNQCVSIPEVAQGYNCSCSIDEGFLASPDGLSCIYYPDPCSLDPCLQAQNDGNQCVPDGSGGYTCNCASRWVNSRGSCAPQNLCMGDPCQISAHKQNQCTIDLSTGQATCQCDTAGRWFATGPQPACKSIPDPCLNDPCSVTQEPLNVCLEVSLGNVSCVCAGNWKQGPGGSTCVPKRNPCLTNPCQTSQDPANTCQPVNENTPICFCDGRGWKEGVNGTSCIPIPNPCLGPNNPCTITDTVNQCIDNRDETYRCVCGSGYRAGTSTGAGGVVIPLCIADPCSTDPCGHSLDPLNTCTAGSGNTFQCNCNPTKYYSGTNGLSCKLIPDPCKSSPCNSLRDVRNTCVPCATADKSKYPGCYNVPVTGYVCSCQGTGFITRSNQQGCDPIPNPCTVGIHCNATVKGNLCVDNQDGTFSCVCSATGWKIAPDQHSCVAPPSKCTQGNPCSIASGRNNVCVDNLDGTYYCRCLQAGWLTTAGSQGCIAPPVRCVGEDPCSSSLASRNVCVDNLDGTYFCWCNATGWITPAGRQRCVAPANPCLTNGDPCLGLSHPGNFCVDNRNATFRCTCGAPGWTVAPGQRSCNPPPPSCVGDPCNAKGNILNVCFDNKDGTYTCTCGGKDWVVSTNGKTCVAPINPCSGTQPGIQACRTREDSFNLCVSDGGLDYHCMCYGRGYVRTADTRFCTPPVNYCSNPLDDVCGMTLSGNSNVCVNNGDGTYQCQCLKSGWTSVVGLSRCISPPNFCLQSDPCASQLNRQNFCVDNRDGTYRCNCQGRGWTTSADLQTCVPPTNPCTTNTDDPCSTQASSLNYCIDNRDGSYRCECDAPGWAPSKTAQSCVCPSPCTQGDPCATLEDPANTCAQSSITTGGPNGCGTYTCNCGAARFDLTTTAWGTQRCAPQNPCLLGDPCLYTSNSGNACISTYRGASAFYDSASDPLNPLHSGYSVLNGVPIITVLPAGLIPYRRQASEDDVPTRRQASEDDVPTRRQASASDKPTRRQAVQLGTTVGGLNEIFSEVGSYFCVCGGAGWITPLGAQTCSAPNPCLVADPCLHLLHRLNVCTPGSGDSDTTTGYAGLRGALGYQCTCGGPGFYTLPGGQACKQCTNPCLVGDPCSSSLSNNNVCVWDPTALTVAPSAQQVTLSQTGQCGTYTCVCDQVTFNAPLGGQSCQRCTDYCVQDPCNVGLDNTNNCTRRFPTLNSINVNGSRIPASSNSLLSFPSNTAYLSATQISNLQNQVCGYWQCGCNINNGWVTPVGALTCVKCTDPCASDPCKGALDPGNVCVKGYTFGGTTSSRRLLQTSFNSITTTGQSCGPFTCTCNGVGWKTSPAGTACIQCIDPCVQAKSNGDLCRTLNSNANSCTVIQSTSGGSVGPQPVGRRLLATPALPVCGAYTCVCGTGWSLSSDNSRCLPVCTNPCSNADPCSATTNSQNSCSFVAPVSQYVCGTYTCACAPGWTAGFGKQSCIPPTGTISHCSGQDNCHATGNPGNQCVQTVSRYRCVCNTNLGWQLSADGYACYKPASNTYPCQNQNNCQTANLGNLCVDLGSSYQCDCTAPGFQASSDFLACIAVAITKRCADIGQTSGNNLCQVSNRNKCTDNSAGGYTCTCVSPFTASANKLSCNLATPTNCAVHDNCLATYDPINQCIVDTARSTYHCRCGAGYFQSTDEKRCIPDGITFPPPSCSQNYNLCTTSSSNSNYCTDLGSGTGYRCTCGTGFFSSPLAHLCLPLPSSSSVCSAGYPSLDPCITDQTLTLANQCTPSSNGYTCNCLGGFTAIFGNLMCRNSDGTTLLSAAG